jgi:hypothetical protein
VTIIGGGPVAVSTPAASLPPTPDEDPAWSPAANPAVAALLDHLAVELAHAYIRLMEHAAQDATLIRESATKEA